MSFFPLLLFLTVGLSYIMDINTEFIIRTLQKLFPEASQQFLKLMLTLAEKRTIFGLIGLLISFYFATSIFTALHSAFIYIFNGREEGVKKKALVYLLGVPIFTLTLTGVYFLGASVSFILDIIKSFQLWKYIENIFGTVHLEFLLQAITNVSLIIQYIGFVIILFMLYKYLAPHYIYSIKIILYVAVLIAFILFGLSVVFNNYILIASKANPIYGALSGIFAFLAWLYLTFGIILIGGRMLYYLELIQE